MGSRLMMRHALLVAAMAMAAPAEGRLQPAIGIEGVSTLSMTATAGSATGFARMTTNSTPIASMLAMTAIGVGFLMLVGACWYTLVLAICMVTDRHFSRPII
jgi:hypothetical protein